MQDLQVRKGTEVNQTPYHHKFRPSSIDHVKDTLQLLSNYIASCRCCYQGWHALSYHGKLWYHIPNLIIVLGFNLR